MSIFSKFFCIISLIAILISIFGMIVFFANLFFCIKRYVLHIRGVDTELSTIVLDTCLNAKQDLSPADIVRKTLLKEQIDKFARDTSNVVKSNNYLSERKEDIVDSTYKKELERINKIYITLDKMPINNIDELNEVEFLFNKGHLRSNEEIKQFYMLKSTKEEQEEYRESNFVNDLFNSYKESDISIKLITGISLMFISYMYFFYKIHIEPSPSLRWNYIDILYFISYVLKTVFDPYYSYSHDVSDYNGVQLFFSLSLIASITISFLIGGGTTLVIRWLTNNEIKDIYNKAGLKKKPDIMLGVNTASYLYVLHKLLKKRK